MRRIDLTILVVVDVIDEDEGMRGSCNYNWKRRLVVRIVRS
jgi:hypothetical protein